MNYDALWDVLNEALAQATQGKGNERHAAGRDFEDQPIVQIPKMLQDDDGFGLIYQAIKKLQESMRLPVPMRRAERLGAINYIAASLLLPGCDPEESDELFSRPFDAGGPPNIVLRTRGTKPVKTLPDDPGTRARVARSMWRSTWTGLGGSVGEWEKHNNAPEAPAGE